LQYIFYSMEFFLQLDIILPIVYNNNMFNFCYNINQLTFGILLDGIIWTPEFF